MVKLSANYLDKLMNDITSKNIAVLGDVMLDVYYWGGTSRISPEAPVPVVDIYREERKPGGAANVALNLAALNSKTTIIGVIGDDSEGKLLIQALEENSINTDGIIISSSRPTTAKTRILAAGQHVVRFDKENKKEIKRETEEKIVSYFKENIQSFAGIILEDYNKGLLTENLIKEIVKIANENGVIIGVDPKFINIEAYQGVTLFKPNLKETAAILNRNVETIEEIDIAGHELIKKLECKYVVITLSERGMALFERGKEMKIVPAKATKIANVSGAGDTVIATLISALASGTDIITAGTLANYAASVVVEDVSIVPITSDGLISRLKEAGIVYD